MSADRVRRFLEAARAQCRTGGTGTSGHDTAGSDTFDCSELVSWAAAQVELTVADEPHALYLDMEAIDALIDVRRAVDTAGALLFTFSDVPVKGAGPPSTANVAISLGDGSVIEARDSRDGIGVFPASGTFTAAALIPGLDDPPPPSADAPPPPHVTAGLDPFADPLPDHYGVSHTLAPDEADVGGDGVTDGYDVVVHGARAMSADRTPPKDPPADPVG